MGFSLFGPILVNSPPDLCISEFPVRSYENHPYLFFPWLAPRRDWCGFRPLARGTALRAREFAVGERRERPCSRPHQHHRRAATRSCYECRRERQTIVPSPSEYVLDSFRQTDRIAILVLNRNFRRDHPAHYECRGKQASPEFQAWLRYKNANGSDIYVGMNPLRRAASTRTKEDIESIRHVISTSTKAGQKL